LKRKRGCREQNLKCMGNIKTDLAAFFYYEWQRILKTVIIRYRIWIKQNRYYLSEITEEPLMQEGEFKKHQNLFCSTIQIITSVTYRALLTTVTIQLSDRVNFVYFMMPNISTRSSLGIHY
jgi:hypothetical protein